MPAFPLEKLRGTMVVKMMLLAVTCFLPGVLSASINAAPQMSLAVDLSPKLTLSSTSKRIQEAAVMEQVFDRSVETHRASMVAISATLTLPMAIKVIQNSSEGESPKMKVVTNLLSSSKSLRSSHDGDMSGIGGLDGARKMLNDMILESMTKYDGEIAKCTSYYAKQCALMETARGQISAANSIAANSRALILDAQANINRDEVDVPKTKQELADHNSKCKSELRKLNTHLKRVMEDISIMTMILKMTDCDTKLMQMPTFSMLRCEDQCTKKTLVTFNHDKLQQEVQKLHAADLVQAAFGELFADDDGEPVNSTGFVQVEGSDYMVLEGDKPKKRQKACQEARKDQVQQPAPSTDKGAKKPLHRPECWCTWNSKQASCQVHTQEGATVLQHSGPLLADPGWH